MGEIATGRIVDLWEQGGIITAVSLGMDGKRVRLLTERGREMRVPAGRIAHQVARPPVATSPPEPAVAAAAEHGRMAEEASRAVELRELWELLFEDRRKYSLEELTELGSAGENPLACSAVLRRLSRDRVFFKNKGDGWEPRTRELVEESERREELERRRAELRGRFLALARAPQPPAAEELAPFEEIVTALRDVAVQGDASSHRREVVPLFEALKLRSPVPGEQAFELLCRLGVFDPDENLHIHRLGLADTFPDGCLARAETVAAAPLTPEGRRDLREWTTFTIDDPSTTELDDALTLEPLEGGRSLIGVHIADPAHYVEQDDDLDREAAARAATYYFPDRRLLMLPPALSEGVASLLPGADRPAVSFLVTVGPDGELERVEIVESVIHSDRRLGYTEADGLLERGEDDPVSARVRGLFDLYELLSERRRRAGALMLRSPEISLHVDDGEIHLERLEGRGPTRSMVAEMAILANSSAAAHLLEAGAPTLFRSQPAPDGKLPELPEDHYDPVRVRAARRMLRRAETRLDPSPHEGLGVPAYSQVTSPLRRYQDLVMHRQLKAVVRGQQPPYDREALRRISALTDEAERAARQAERGAVEYWVLRYLESRERREVEVVVVDTTGRRTLVEISEVLHTCPIASRPDHRPGRRLRCIVESVQPRRGTVHLREVGS